MHVSMHACTHLDTLRGLGYCSTHKPSIVSFLLMDGAGGDWGVDGELMEDENQLWDADEKPLLFTIPLSEFKEELERRKVARRQQAQYCELCKAADQAGSESPPMPKYDIRIWWKNAWHKRIELPRHELKEWKMANLRGRLLEDAKQRPPDADFRTSGDKVLEAGRAYIRRVPGQGLAVFGGKNGLPGNTILCMYPGHLFHKELLSKHMTAQGEATHHLALRIVYANMPEEVTGINGSISHEHIDCGDGHFIVPDLDYHVRNGPGSLLNSRSSSVSNCKLVVEYHSYQSCKGKLHVGDDMCPETIPRKNQVLYKGFFPVSFDFLSSLCDLSVLVTSTINTTEPTIAVATM